MSNVKRRFQKKTGIEYFDNAVELDREVWSFIKHEFKNKTKKEASDNPEMKDAPEGCIPYRYWDTHGKVLHKYVWELMRNVRLTYQISQPRSQKELEDKKKFARTALGWCWNIYDALYMTAEELPMVDIDKMDNAFELLDKEIGLLEGVMKKSKIHGSKEITDSSAEQQ